MNKCSDCKKELNSEAKYSKTIKCHSCENKRRHRLGIFKIKYGIDNPNYKKGLPHCQDCGIQLKDYNSKRCSDCWYIFNTGINNTVFTGGEKSRECFCVDCRKKLNITAYYNNNKRCYKCNGKNRMGINSTNWNNGSSFEPYSFEFNVKLKESIRKRDDHKCQNCGMTEEEHLIVIGYVLIIHHIDYNKDNCKENNLITVCQSCNARANFNRYYWQNLYQQKIKFILTENGGITKNGSTV
jgi:hypothetical protein